MSRKDRTVKNAKIAPGHEVTIMAQQLLEKLQAGRHWCEASYGDASIMHDILCELEADAETIVKVSFEKGGRS